MNKYLFLFVSLVFSLYGALIQAGEMLNPAVIELQKQWAINNYQLKGDVQKIAFGNLVEQASNYTEQHSTDAAVFIWSGIIKSTYAGVKGGLGALRYAKASKRDFERALALDPNALNGSAYTSLGTLYFKVPGWPVGFGSDKKAENMLKTALDINPQGIDANYFYAEYLRKQKQWDQANIYLEKARSAAPRTNRIIADRGRHDEIDQALAMVKQHRAN